MTNSEFRVPGFEAAGVECGIKPQGLDLALITSAQPSAVAGVFTRSTVVGAPVEVSRERVAAGWSRGVVVNSGCSNVAMGARGVRDARAMAKSAADVLGVRPEQMLVASTGVIGEPLPMGKIRRGVKAAARSLTAEGLPAAARAIMTTDTYPKLASTRVRIAGQDVTLVGIAKGSGMIEPNMATMLGYLFTDAAVSPAFLRRVLRSSSEASFNRVSVDGETSTSDMVLLFANGMAGNSPLKGPRSPGASAFSDAVLEVSTRLARDLARDGEGATKLVTVSVRGARNPIEAERAARRIANSVLVKTALFGRDPNWGRILQAVGAGQITIRLPRAEVRLCGVPVFRHGSGTGSAARRRALSKLAADEVEIEVALGAGRGKATLWTCDLSYDYVRINAEYTT
ncbi:bifunctional glutamate N-acetyltransferase/amino-acid acetyltransferase ArgJ [Myxococcota bacterium]|nr:bifunctional glutamate N-acetyltransferase/amino-acid acetyltransferase ArgJ [Myxococcota bacterium]